MRPLRLVPHRQPTHVPDVEGREQDDLDLVARLAMDDGSALGELLQRYWKPMVAFAFDRVRSQDAAEDAVQETFVRVWEKRHVLHADASPRAYLYKVLRNLITDEFRRRRLRDRFAFFRSLQDPAEVPTPSAILEGEELAGAAHDAISSLPERRRDVFVLAHLHGMSYREVGAALGITPRTVANHMTLALTQLRELLSAYTSRARGAPRAGSRGRASDGPPRAEAEPDAMGAAAPNPP
ncbi:MAG: sigma-70 family RNA polymerase sigma factor [Gemmatimonadetes bacterium]|nr:sigma-70 family RNA polymerase sigma factor [Gemmatimonadota bacterium]